MRHQIRSQITKTTWKLHPRLGLPMLVNGLDLEIGRYHNSPCAHEGDPSFLPAIDHLWGLSRGWVKLVLLESRRYQ